MIKAGATQPLLLMLNLPCGDNLKHRSVIPSRLRLRVRGLDTAQRIQRLLHALASCELGLSPMRPDRLVLAMSGLGAVTAPQGVFEYKDFCKRVA